MVYKGLRGRVGRLFRKSVGIHMEAHASRSNSCVLFGYGYLIDEIAHTLRITIEF